MKKRTVVNRFNNLSSKEWLPFQKSWFLYENDESLFTQNLRFFTKSDESNKSLVYFNATLSRLEKAKIAALKQNIDIIDELDNTDGREMEFAFIDLRDISSSKSFGSNYEKIKKGLNAEVVKISKLLSKGRFLAIAVDNTNIKGYIPVAWDLAKSISQHLSLKDEKIACKQNGEVFFILYFRNDDNAGKISWQPPCEWKKIEGEVKTITKPLPSWFILKPQGRKKNEILHPAKYPEDLTNMYIKAYTEEGDWVFDPMCGTGSTQVSALILKRNTIGVELSDFFARIAEERCQAITGTITGMYETGFKIINSDIADVNWQDLPQPDYIITSPPYWDMLNMKGAENQAKRRKSGLQTNYSDNERDLGNISDYTAFLDSLCDIYLKMHQYLKKDGHLTIVIKNIKKSGTNYPLAWDIIAKLQSEYLFTHLGLWCQDDLSIAPYGYGNTWVSNTFHHYCLSFRKV